MSKKKIITLLIAASMLTSAIPTVFADNAEQPMNMPMPSMADGQQPPEMQGGQMQMPNGQMQGGQMQMPDGQQPPEMLNGQQMPDGQQPPEMPNGQMQDGQQPPEMPNGQMQDGQQPPEMQGGFGAAVPFKDVAEDSWYYNTVSKAYSQGFITGMSDDEFSPETSVTGAQLITMFFRADGNKTSEQTTGNWYDEAVAWAEQNAIVSDDNGWSFEPNAELTREQMMVLLYKYITYKGENSADSDDLSKFSDSADISAYALNAVKKLVAIGLISGDGETLRPHASLTRAETATILVNAAEKLNSGSSIGGNGIGGGNNMMTPPNGAPGGFGGSGTVTQGTSASTISEDGTYSGTSYTSSGDDENALRIDGAEVSLDSITVDKSAGASSNTEDGDFYGQNAALLATNGANVTITNANVSSSAQNGNGVFSYGSGTTVTISDSTITTTSDNSGGIQTTGGGTTYASNLTVNTSGQSAAAIRSDRGGGTVVVDKGSYVSNGYNSPAVYSTADITVSNAALTANNSEALVIEGKNSIKLENCEVSGNMSSTQGSSSDENVHNVMIYQSMSGDADVGTSVFTMTGGSLTGNNGDMIYVTNTHSIITLSDVDITNKDSDAYLMRVTGNSAKRGWGSAGANGAQVEFTADAQTLEGNIAVDTISTLDFTLTNNSSLTGCINIIENAQGGTAVSDNADVTIGEGCVWTLTGDCTVTSLENNGTINFNGYTITLADGTVLSE
jgi:hypothetical protein